MGLFKQSCKRPDGTKYKSDIWSFSFTHPLTGRQVKRSTGIKNKAAAQKMLDEAKAAAQAQEWGLIDQSQGDLRKPLSGHIDDYKQHLIDKKRAPAHIQNKIPRIRTLLGEAKCVHWSDIDAGKVERALADLARRNNHSDRTRNAYLKETKSFLTWMVKNKRARSNPLQYAEGVTVTDATSYRAPTPEELSMIIEAAKSADLINGVPGAERAMLYLVGAFTGFRFNELRSLKWSQLRLNGAALVELPARSSKHRKLDRQPIPSWLAEELLEWQVANPDSEAVFPHITHWHKSNRFWNVDRKAAGVPRLDQDGRPLVYHGLRRYFITNVRGCSDLQTWVALARHTDPKLTLHYSDDVPASQRKAVEDMPRLPQRSVG
jgi:integrase